MGALQMIGYPPTEADGTFRVKAQGVGDEVHLLSSNGYPFARCKIIDNKPVIEIWDASYQRAIASFDIGIISWAR